MWKTELTLVTIFLQENPESIPYVTILGHTELTLKISSPKFSAFTNGAYKPQDWVGHLDRTEEAEHL